MVDITLLFQDETIKKMPIIDVVNVLTAIQKLENKEVIIIDKHTIKKEVKKNG